MAATLHINYPTGGTVPGGGGFFTWGAFSGGMGHATSATATWSGGSASGIDASAPAPCSWAFQFNNVATGTTITLTVNGQDSMGNLSQQQVTFTCGGILLQAPRGEKQGDSQESPPKGTCPPG